MTRFKAILPVLAISAALLAAQPAQACPNCKEAVANQEGADGEGLRQGYFWSIIMMLSVPLSVVSAGTFMVVRAAKRGALPEM